MAIFGQARLGAGRLNAFRLNCVSPSVFITIGGTRRETKTRLSSVQIVDVLGAQHATRAASLRVWGFTPTALQDVKIYVGAFDVAALQFGGIIQSLDQVYEDAQANVAWDLHCVDYLPLFNRRLVYKTYTNLSATVIAQDLIANYTTGFSSARVQLGLPTASLTCDGLYPGDALSQLQTQVPGSSWLLDPSKTVYFFTTDPRVPPATMTEANTTMDAPLVATTDGSQVRTRIHVIGASSPTLTAVAAGDPILPLQSVAMFDVQTGQAHVASPAQIVSYTGVVPSAGGSIVGPGVTPSAAPNVGATGGGSVDTGSHGYAYTWGTGAGETLPSPLKTISTTTVALSVPTQAPVMSSLASGGSQLTNATSYTWAITYATDSSHETTIGPDSNAFVAAANTLPVLLLASAPPTALGWNQPINVYRKIAGVYYRENSFITAINFSGGIYGNAVEGTFASDATLVANNVQPSGANTATLATGSMSGIGVGPATTTSRKIYRTAAGSTQLKLLHTLADNTTTVWTDTAADATLGANAPVGDTSGLAQPTGQVLAGSTTLLLAGAGAFSTGGGWALLSSQMAVRYTGISMNTLTGIPASGAGSLMASVLYGTTVTAAPMLTGIPASGAGSITTAIPIGQPVALFLQVEDLAAEATLATSEGGDGIHEFPIVDATIGTTAAAFAAAAAELALFKAVETKLSPFSTRDRNILAGTPVLVAFGAPTSVSGTYTAQRVTITSIGIPANQETNNTAPGKSAGPFTWPLRTIEASATALTLTDLLARLVRLPRK